MQKVAVMTDTNSGFIAEDAAEKGVFLLPMPFIVNGELLLEGPALTHEHFYDMLDRDAEVSTSQPAPEDVTRMWDCILAQGYEEIVYIPMSSGLSSSCQSAIALAEDYGGRVQVVDNHRISVTMKQSVLDAATCADAGLSAREIKKRLEDNAYQASIYITLDTLKYLKKGGRVTAAGAAIGTILNLKPVLTIQGGKLDAHAKVRGMKAGRRTMLESMQKDVEERFSEALAQGRLSLFIAYSHVDAESLDSWRQEVQATFPSLPLREDPLTLSVGCHIGPGALAVAICEKEQ